MTSSANFARNAGMRWIVSSVVLVAATAMITTRVVSQDKEKGPPLSPEEQKMMEACMKAATPGEQHAHLAKRVGTWDAATKFWMDPTKPPEVGTGTATIKSILDGRFVKTDYEGSSSMGPFQGFGISGYDNVGKKYVDIWLDTMGTGLMISEGTSDAAGKSFTFVGSYNCPIIGGKKTLRWTTRMISDSKMVFEMFDKTPEGKEFRNMEIIYNKR